MENTLSEKKHPFTLKYITRSKFFKNRPKTEKKEKKIWGKVIHFTLLLTRTHTLRQFL